MAMQENSEMQRLNFAIQGAMRAAQNGGGSLGSEWGQQQQSYGGSGGGGGFGGGYVSEGQSSELRERVSASLNPSEALILRLRG